MIMGLGRSIKWIEDNTGLLPHVLAIRNFWNEIEAETPDSARCDMEVRRFYEYRDAYCGKMTDEELAKLEEQWVKWAMVKFVNAYNSNKAGISFRKSIARVQSLDDLPEIDKWFIHWFRGWLIRRVKMGNYIDELFKEGQ